MRGLLVLNSITFARIIYGEPKVNFKSPQFKTIETA